MPDQIPEPRECILQNSPPPDRAAECSDKALPDYSAPQDKQDAPSMRAANIRTPSPCHPPARRPSPDYSSPPDLLAQRPALAPGLCEPRSNFSEDDRHCPGCRAT